MNNKSNISEDKFLAVLDILGFSDLLSFGNLDKIQELYEELIEGDLASVSGRQFKNDDLNNSGLNFFIISDSVLIYTNDLTYASFQKLVYITRLFFTISFLRGLPLRGTITKGEIRNIDSCSTNRDIKVSVILGKPISNAYNLEKQYEWAGCTIDPVCILCFPLIANGRSSLRKNNIIVQYAVPKKAGKINVEKDYVINWVNHFKNIDLRTTLNENDIQSIFAMHGKKIDDWSVIRKINNTYSFYNWCKRQKFHMVSVN